MFDFKFDFLTPEQNALFSEAVNCFFGYEISALRAANKALEGRFHAAERNAAFLFERNEMLGRQTQEACKEAEKLKEELREVRLELVDCRRANVVLRESLEKERGQAVKLSAPSFAFAGISIDDVDVDVDADADIKPQDHVMAKAIKKLKEELREVRLELVDSRNANVVLSESLEKERAAERPVPAYEIDKLRSENAIMAGVIEKLKNELRTYKDFAKRLIRTMETAPVAAKEVLADEET